MRKHRKRVFPDGEKSGGKKALREMLDKKRDPHRKCRPKKKRLKTDDSHSTIKLAGLTSKR